MGAALGLHTARIIFPHQLLTGEVPGVVSIPEEKLGPELHHLRRVLRVNKGDLLEILDSNSPNVIRATIEELPEKALVLSLLERIERPAPPKITLAVGLTAPQTLETVIEKLTELEVSELAVFFAKNSQHAEQLDRIEKRFERIERIRDAARIQSGSRVTLNLSVYESLEFFLSRAPETSLKLLCSLAPSAPNLVNLLEKKKAIEGTARTADAILILGPEGGLRDEEEQSALSHGFESVSLGDSILRVDTAAISAVAVVRLALTS